MNIPDAEARSACPARLPLPGWRSAWSGLWSITWRSAWSARRWPVLGLLIIASPVLAWLTLQTDPAEMRSGWVTWITGVHFGLVIPLWCLIAFGSFIRDEVQAGTIGFLLTRPLTRSQFVLVRWVCTLATIQLPLTLITLLLGATAVLLQIPHTILLTALLLGAQLVVVPAYGAIAAFLGLLTRKYLLLGLVYGFVVEVGIGQIPTNINTLSVSRHFRTLLEQFDSMARALSFSAADVWWSVAMLLLLTLLYLGAATLCFTFREYSQSEESK